MRLPVWLIVAVLALLAACGGGSSAPVVAFLGDSLTSGTHSISATAWVPGTWSPTPVQHMAALGDFAAVDLSSDGATSADASIGHHADVTVLAFGVADAARGITPDQTRAALTALANDRRTVIVGVIAVPEIDTAAHDAAARQAAQASGAFFADVRALPPGAFVDGLHPDQSYSQRLGALITKTIKEALRV
jgi:lysophospholipase L1-like esterase